MTPNLRPVTGDPRKPDPRVKTVCLVFKTHLDLGGIPTSPRTCAGATWTSSFRAPSLLNFHQRRPSAHGGVHVNLYNNVWGTNFPLWYNDNVRFRFRLRPGALR